MTQTLNPLFGAYLSDSMLALNQVGPPGVYEGLDPTISGIGGTAGWTLTIAPGAWRTAGDVSGTLLASAHGRYVVREDVALTFGIAGPSSQNRIDLLVGYHEWVAGAAETGSSPSVPSGVYDADQKATYAIVQGTPAATPGIPTVADPGSAGPRPVILAEIYVPASGNPTATIYAANNMRLEYMAALVAEVTAARGGQANLSAELATLAPLASPPLTGIPTAPTAAPGTSTMQLANTAFVAAAVAALVNAAPGTLDTLNELAAALGNDASFAADIAAQIALKAPLASPALTGAPTAPTAAPGTSNTQIATTAFASGVIPSGAIIPYGGVVAPSGYLACDGSNVSRTAFANLFAAIGSIYGNGDGYSTFTLPNMQGLFPLGKSGAYPIGSSGGAATHVLTVAEIPGHSHNVSHSLNPAGSPVGGAIGGTTPSMDGEVYTDSTGGGGAHNNMPPYLALNFIIKT